MAESRTLHAPDEASLQELLAELGEAARAWRFRVAPNPSVGAAVLAGGAEVGRGFHEDWGGAHAEVQALEAARQSGVEPGAWDLLAVTLEPCSSDGKTGPCTRAILAERAAGAGLARLVAGAVDPDPRHRGRGLAELEAGGIETRVVRRAAPLERVAPAFLSWTDPDRLRRPRPWTIAKWAQTPTGQLSPRADVGGGRWITGPEARAEVQGMRARVDAIVTGVGTVLADDPLLTVRPPARSERPPLRVVMDTELRTPPDARLLAPAVGEDAGRGGAVHVLCRAGAAPPRHRTLEAAGARIHGLRPGRDGRVSLRAVQEWLWEAGVRRLLLEAGPTLLQAWFERDFVDQIAVYTGTVAGGRGPSLAPLLARERLADPEHREAGGDHVLEAFYR